jgi:hypothetical protein
MFAVFHLSPDIEGSSDDELITAERANGLVLIETGEYGVCVKSGHNEVKLPAFVVLR